MKNTSLAFLLATTLASAPAAAQDVVTLHSVTIDASKVHVFDASAEGRRLG